MNLDMNRILSTDQKVLCSTFKELVSDYSEDLAERYFFQYKDKPLSFILKNSNIIFAEPKFGIVFYKKLLRRLPLTELSAECDKLKNYIKSYAALMHEETKKEYESCLEYLEELIEDSYCLLRLEGAVDSRYSGFVEKSYELCQMILDCERDVDHDISNLKEFVHQNPLISLIYMVFTNSDCLKGLSADICGGLLKTEREDKTIHETIDVLQEAVYISSISESKMFKEAVSSIKNIDVLLMLEFAGKEDICTAFTEAVCKSFDVEDDVVLPNVTVDTFVESVMDDMVYNKLTEEETSQKKLSILTSKRRLYESVLSIIQEEFSTRSAKDTLCEIPFFTQIKNAEGIYEKMTVEDGLRFMVEQTASIESEMRYLTEYTEDGTPNKVIWSKGNAPRENSTKSSKSASSDNDDDDSDTDIPESERFKGVPSSADLPDSSNPHAKQPKKPKSGIVGNIQNKAMDMHAASKRAASKTKSAVQGVVNTGKAVLKIPTDIIDGFKNTLKAFDDADDKRRERYMVKPGYRKKIFKNLRVAATYGASFYIGKYMVIITWLAGRFSKEKNKRVRSEFAAELATEIKVCEAKIEDATAAGDQKQRYQLMRLRDKLEREKSRVELNAKYI